MEERRRARVELVGVVVGRPEYRVTPRGEPWLTLVLECGEQGRQLRLEVAIGGARARELATDLTAGTECIVLGSLRAALRTDAAGIRRPGLEVIASKISPI